MINIDSLLKSVLGLAALKEEVSFDFYEADKTYMFIHGAEYAYVHRIVLNFSQPDTNPNNLKIEFGKMDGQKVVKLFDAYLERS